MSPGHETCGGVVSTIATAKVQLPEVPKLSVAVQMTLLWPRRNPVPDGGIHVTGTGLPLKSTAVAVKLTGVRPPVHSATTLGGQVNTGGGSEVTETFTTADAVRRCLSWIV